MSASLTVDIITPDFDSSVRVPRSAILHLPPADLNISRLVLCRNFDPHHPKSSCRMHNKCKFVHLSTTLEQLSIKPQAIHVKYSWKHEDYCQYPRLDEYRGKSLQVSAPNQRAPVFSIPAERILVTQGSVKAFQGAANDGTVAAPGVMPSHCAHYFFNRLCLRGESCVFIHSIDVDPSQGRVAERNVNRVLIPCDAPRALPTKPRDGVISASDCVPCVGALVSKPFVSRQQSPTEHEVDNDMSGEESTTSSSLAQSTSIDLPAAVGDRATSVVSGHVRRFRFNPYHGSSIRVWS